MTTFTRAIALATAAGFITMGAVAHAQTQADFDACNKQAQSAGSGTPSASPSAGASSGTPSASPSAGAAMSGSVGASGSATTPGASSSPPATSPGSSSAGASSEAQLKGMASVGQSDQAYQQAYRDCMRGRGF